MHTCRWVETYSEQWKPLCPGDFSRFLDKTDSCVSNTYWSQYIYIYINVCVCVCEIHTDCALLFLSRLLSSVFAFAFLLAVLSRAPAHTTFLLPCIRIPVLMLSSTGRHLPRPLSSRRRDVLRASMMDVASWLNRACCCCCSGCKGPACCVVVVWDEAV